MVGTCGTAELEILEAKTPELRLTEVNGTYADLVLHCVGQISKSTPQWKHNGMIVHETSDTALTGPTYDALNERMSLIMTRRNVTERFAGSYQCVDTKYLQSDSDILTIHAGARSTYPGTWHATHIYVAILQ